MTLYSGDVIACGTNHEGLGPLQDGEVVELEVEKVGKMRLYVKDALKRQWTRTLPPRRSSACGVRHRRAANPNPRTAGRTGCRQTGKVVRSEDARKNGCAMPLRMPII